MRKRGEIFRSELFFSPSPSLCCSLAVFLRCPKANSFSSPAHNRRASEGVYKRLWWKIEHEKIKLNITNMPYWHIIKVEHIRLCTNSSVLCWSFLLSLQCWESRASLDRPRSNAKYFSHGRDRSRVVPILMCTFSVCLLVRKKCVYVSRWRSKRGPMGREISTIAAVEVSKTVEEGRRTTGQWNIYTPCTTEQQHDRTEKKTQPKSQSE